MRVDTIIVISTTCSEAGHQLCVAALALVVRKVYWVQGTTATDTDNSTCVVTKHPKLFDFARSRQLDQ